jgi:bifunctional non-homologous end joining protein LigD
MWFGKTPMAERNGRIIEVDGREVEIGHADKVLFPDCDLTKLDLAGYYARIGETALPHYRGRALSMHRYPDGIGTSGFFQKQIGDHFPDWIARATLPKQDGEVTYVVADSAATLVYLADQGCITPHLSLSRTDRPDHPDRMVFDLDPSDDDFGKVRKTARLLRRTLDELDLPTFVQTTGSRGLHLVVPLDRSADFDTVRSFTHGLCADLAVRHPNLMTVAQRKSERGNRVFLDDLRNAYGQTAVAPYAVRARPGAPVATPLNWDELRRAELHPRRYRIDNLFRRMAQVDDPWAGIGACAVSLPPKSRWPGGS